LSVFSDGVFVRTTGKRLGSTIHDPRSGFRRDPCQRFLSLLLVSDLTQPRKGSIFVSGVGISCGEVHLGDSQIWLASDGLHQVLSCLVHSTLLKV
jgi:hypothetical protein